MKQAVVVTTINPITEALEAFAEIEDWDLIVVGDTKTPEESYNGLNGTYMSPGMQEDLYPELSELLGWKTVDRRNLGFLYAYEQGAEVVAMVDDDNIPHENWGKNLLLNKDVKVEEYEAEMVFDPFIRAVENGKVNDGGDLSRLWHRGFPIELVEERTCNNIGTTTINPLVQAELWEDDPDVDAVCRMKYNPRGFTTDFPFFTTRAFSPFNMQNSMVAREALKYVISIPFTGRMCDIWGAYYFQAHCPGRTVYGPPTVVHTQERSWESLVFDMEEEILGYRSTLALLKDLLKDPESIHKYIPTEASVFIKEYQKYFD